MKKGQSLSMNTIIIAAIALVVLVVLVVLVLNAGSGVANATACEQSGGECMPKKDCEDKGSLFRSAPLSCGNDDEANKENICCMGVEIKS